MRLRQQAAVAASLVTLAACGNGGSASVGGDNLEDMAPVTLRVSTHEGPDTATGIAYDAFKEYVEKESGGKIEVEVHTSGSLVSPQDALSATGAGTADISQLITSYWPQDLPVSSWMLKLGATADPSLPYGVLQQSAALNEMFLDEEALAAEYEEHNLKVLSAWTTEPYTLVCNSPVEKLDQAEGKRVRVSGELWAAEAESIGMVPVTMTPPEVYEALQRGAVDCASFSPGAVFINGYFDIVQDFTAVSMSSLPGCVIAMNLSVWESLPKEAQEIVWKASQELWSTFLEKQMDLVAKAGAAENAVFHNPSELDEVINAHQEEVVAEMASEPPAGVSDGQAVVDEYDELMRRWSALLEDEVGTGPVPQDPESIQTSYAKASDFDHAKFRELAWDEAFEPYLE